MLYIKEEYSRDKYIYIFYLSYNTDIIYKQTILLNVLKLKYLRYAQYDLKKKLTSQETGKCNLYFKQNI